jgi:hypothetical protein
MQKQSSDDYKKLKSAFTEANNAFRNDFAVIYGTEQQRANAHFDRFKQIWKGWDKPGRCMYQGCSNPTIRRSHAIQKSAHLEHLAEDQHVLSPQLNARGQLEMKRIGVNLASTFPGFCEDHERIFSEFEAVGAISTPRHFGLQAFRTLCREIFRKRREISDHESAVDQYRKTRSNYFVSAVESVVPDATVHTLEIKGDGMERFVLSRIRESQLTLAELEGDLYDELFEFINDDQKEPCLNVLRLPFEVPVACSGLGNLTYMDWSKKKKKEAFCPLGILPQPGAAIAYFTTSKKHSGIAEMYFAQMSRGFGALNAMESWIVNGSDHWFMRPSAWDSIPALRQRKILAQIGRDDDNLGSFLSFSIFDDARRQIIAWIKEGLDEADTKNRRKLLNMIEKESAKLTS